MKIRNLLTMLAVVLAIGSAFASEFFTPPQQGYSSIIQVPVQASDCEARRICDGGTALCKFLINHDNNVNTPAVLVQMYDGTVPEDQDDPICGNELKHGN